jgi:hypothetical protein
MVNTVDLESFQQVKHRLTPLRKSDWILHMADGWLIPSAGIWNGEITVGNTSHGGTFEVFDSNGAWVVLFRKPLLKTFKAVHDYDLDIVKISNGNNSWTKLQNQHQQGKDHRMVPLRWVSHTCNNKEPDNSTDVAHLEHEMNSNQLSLVLPSDKTPPTTPVEEEQHMDTGEPQIQKTLMQQRNLWQTGEERTKWQASINKGPKKTQEERKTAKCNRLARISSKGVISNLSPSPSPEIVTDNRTLGTDSESEQGLQWCIEHWHYFSKW